MDIEKIETETDPPCERQQKKSDAKRQKKDEMLILRLTKDEKKILLDQAHHFNLSLSHYTLKRLFSRQVIVKTINGENQNLRSELNRIGTNLNQLVHILHMCFDRETIDEIKKTVDQIKKIIYQNYEKP